MVYFLLAVEGCNTNLVNQSVEIQDGPIVLCFSILYKEIICSRKPRLLLWNMLMYSSIHVNSPIWVHETWCVFPNNKRLARKPPGLLCFILLDNSQYIVSKREQLQQVNHHVRWWKSSKLSNKKGWWHQREWSCKVLL